MREVELRPSPRASWWLRQCARAFDCAVAFTLFIAAGRAGIVAALLYLLLADGMSGGQSPGKRIFGIKVIYLPMQSEAGYRDSALRNAPLAFSLILKMMPDVGTAAFVFGLSVIVAIECITCWRSPEGIRLGDRWAQTQVVDGKVPTEDSMSDEVDSTRILNGGVSPPSRRSQG